MIEELREIDTEALDELARIQEEREVLDERLARLEEERQGVNEVVYERVKGDYESRLAELEEKARPLEERARAEHGKLQDLADGFGEELEKIRLEKEELELRHRLGELEGDAWEERVGECDQRLEERQGELRELDELRQRFASALRAGDEVPPPPGDDTLPDGSPWLSDVPEGTDVSASAEEDPAAEEDSAAEEVELDEGEETGDFQEVRTAATAPVPAVSPPVPADSTPSESEATVLLKGPRLEIHRDNGNDEMRLSSAAIGIGRAVKNEVRFLSTSVSRHHARISLDDEGWVVRDLGSGNGTLVNGERVEGDRLLRDGDTIQVGSEIVVFRES